SPVARVWYCTFFFFQAEDGIRDFHVTGVQTCALPISADLEEVRVAEHRAGGGVAAARMAPDADAVDVDPRIARGELLHHRDLVRSEERRVGKEGRSRWSASDETKKEQ